MERSLRTRKSRLLLCCVTTMSMWFSLVPSVNSGKIAGPVKFGTAAFQPTTGASAAAMYVGAGDLTGGTPADEAGALSRITLQQNSGAASTVKVTPLAPQATVVINSEKPADSPLYDKVLNNLVLAGQYPVATTTFAGAETKVYMVTSPIDGLKVLTNNDGVTFKNALNDFQRVGMPTQEIKGKVSLWKLLSV